MAILFQKLHEHMIVNGWYGKCHTDVGELVDIEDCPHFDLLSAGNNIKAVYAFQDDMVVHSYTRGAPIFLQDFTRLECGGAYIIYLEKGHGQVNIPHFVSSYSNKDSNQRISDCYFDPSNPPDDSEFEDKISIDSVCPIYDQDDEMSCHTLHITISYETKMERNLNLSVEKSGITQPLYESHGNLVTGRGYKNFLIRSKHILTDADVSDIGK